MTVFPLVLLILFGPVLFGGKLLLPLDNLRGHPPFQNLPPTEPHGNHIQGDLIQLVSPSLVAVRTEPGAGSMAALELLVGAGMPSSPTPSPRRSSRSPSPPFPFPGSGPPESWPCSGSSWP